jgi:hypothetical protein
MHKDPFPKTLQIPHMTTPELEAIRCELQVSNLSFAQVEGLATYRPKLRSLLSDGSSDG